MKFEKCKKQKTKLKLKFSCLGGHFPQSRTYSLIMSSSEDSNLRGCCSSNTNSNNNSELDNNNSNQFVPRPITQHPFSGSGGGGGDGGVLHEVSGGGVGVSISAGFTRRYQKMKKSFSCDSDCVRKTNHMRLSQINSSHIYTPLNDFGQQQEQQQQENETHCSLCCCCCSNTTTASASTGTTVTFTTTMSDGHQQTARANVINAATTSTSTVTSRAARPVWAVDYLR